MAAQYPQSFMFPLPDEEQMAALQSANAYLQLVGTQFASMLIGCPPLDGDTGTLAEFSNTTLRCAALCAGLPELADAQRR